MRNGIVIDATGELERLDVDPDTFDLSGKVLIEDVPDDLTGLLWDTATRAFVEDWSRFNAALHAQIDRTAGEARRPFITVIPAQDVMYQRKAAQARAYGDDPGGTYPALTGEAAARGMTVASLAAEILATEAAWLAILDATEAARLGAKAAVTSATTQEAKEAAALVDWAAVIASAI
jgi:hypothetical protein